MLGSGDLGTEFRRVRWHADRALTALSEGRREDAIYTAGDIQSLAEYEVSEAIEQEAASG